KQVHEAFGGELRAIIVGGAFSEPQTLQFFYDLGIPVANGYGLMEAGTALTVNDLKPFRADTVGKPLPGMEVRIVNPAADGVGERLVLGVHLDGGQEYSEKLRRDMNARNNRLLNYKRVHGVVLLDEDFPRTASLKIKRNVLAERLRKLDSTAAILPL